MGDLVSKMFVSSVNHVSKLIEPQKAVLITSDLQPVGQKHR